MKGGAIGYVAYDCIRHFEPKTARKMTDPLNIPESLFMLCDTIVVFDHLYSTAKVVSHVFLPNQSPAEASKAVPQAYAAARSRIAQTVAKLTAKTALPLPVQPRIPSKRAEAVSNIGKKGYEAHVTRLRQHIVKGDIIQAVPSQRLARPTALHPFNAYRCGFRFKSTLGELIVGLVKQISEAGQSFTVHVLHRLRAAFATGRR